MWRPNPKYSRQIILKTFTQDGDRTDDYGHPVLIPADISLTAEVYPYSNPVNRQAAGITDQDAYTIIFQGNAPSADSKIIMGSRIFRLISISGYAPVQLVAADTGERVEPDG